jgi:putative membrane protein
MAVFMGACLGLQADDKGISAQGRAGSTGAAVDVRTDRADRDARVDYQSNRSDRTDGKLSRGDANFIREAAKGGMMEVKMGQAAKDRASNAEVKSFGEKLVKDHSEENQKLTQLASQKGIDLAKETDKDTAQDHGKMVMDLEKKTGAEFDRAFVKHTLKDHKKDISKFEKASRELEDAELRSFANNCLPKLREHQMEAERLARSLGIDVNVSEASDTDLNARAEASGAPGLSVENRNTSVNRVDSTTDANRGNGRVDIDVDRDRDAKIQTDVDINREPKAEGKVEVDTDKDDGKTLGVETRPGDDRTLGVETKKGDNKILGIETRPGDGKTLGLNTSKDDGKLLGVFPAPGRNKAENQIDVDVDRDNHRVEVDSSVGAPATTEKGASARVDASVDTDKDAKVMSFNETPAKVQATIKTEGGTDTTKVKKHTMNGKTAYKVEIEKDGRNRVLHIAEDGTIIKDNKAK